jgi:hypothetical protein
LIGELEPLSGPIRIADYDPEWARRFELEANAKGLTAALISHTLLEKWHGPIL